MLTGVHPFDGEGISTADQMEMRTMNARSMPLNPMYTSHLSESAINLIKRLMKVNPRKRMTAYQMLHRPWVLGETATTDKMEDSDKKLSQFKELTDKLEAGIFAVLVKGGQKDLTMSEKKTRSLEGRSLDNREEPSMHIMKRAFDAFDAEGKGFVTSNDLGRVVSEHIGSQVSSTDTQEYIATDAAQNERERPVITFPFRIFPASFLELSTSTFHEVMSFFTLGILGMPCTLSILVKWKCKRERDSSWQF
jgi:serine/threonine protein kinase